MQQVLQLLKKIEMLAKQEQPGPIDIDLMLDHTKAIYGCLLQEKQHVPVPIVQAEATGDQENELPKMPLTLADNDEEHDSVQNITAEVATISDRPTAEETENTPISDRDIRRLIGINDKYRFMSELFENDKEAYERALNEINRCTFCREATDWLSQQARGRYNWDHESETVQSFYGIVSHFFASR